MIQKEMWTTRRLQYFVLMVNFSELIVKDYMHVESYLKKEV